ncbi:MAG: type I restriction enzyme HsdR N-terminal domain-containing protein [Nitrososphaerota archaeon]|nr:type I restriction enzyme HsdR N-terminal domain-containing protein [Nitrososphaerota archaeon]MDG7052081.1 type I restriction enzyme HsdR N-terminal domain-containing protein [Nitrososphaerota archaeon]
MDENEIKKYVDKGCKLKDEPEDEVTKIMKELLASMNWPTNDIKPQAPVQSENGKVRSDFLLDDGKNKFIVELKSPTVPLTDERAIKQLRAYLLLHNVPYGVLYNGHELLLMKKEIDEPVFKWTCREDKEDISIFSNLSKGVYPNNIEKLISERQELNKPKVVLRENYEKIKNSVNKMIASDFDIPLETVEKANIRISFSASVPKISRKELASKRDGLVIICPSDASEPDDFLKKYNAWGYVKISRNPIYFALYVNEPESKVLYFGEIGEIIDTKELVLKFGEEGGIDMKDLKAKPSNGNKLIILKPETLWELTDPIKKSEKSKGEWSGIRGVRYSSLINFIKAETIENLSVDE